MTKDRTSEIPTTLSRQETEPVENSTIDNCSAEVRRKIARVMSVNDRGSSFRAYETDHTDNLHPGNNLTFLISPTPFELPIAVKQRLGAYGESISIFYQACDSIFRELKDHHRWKNILTNNRPEWLLQKAKDEDDAISHIFLRPDFILTEDGVVTAEIETSPFGLALALFLNEAYAEDSDKPNSQFVETFMTEVMGNDKSKSLCFMLTEHTKKYRGQFEYLAKLLMENGVNVLIAMPEDIEIKNQECFLNGMKIDVMYRMFYLHEAVQDESIAKILQQNLKVFPGYKSHLEEKAMMAMFFDDEFESIFRMILGRHYDLLKDILPPTYVLHESPPSKLGISNWEELAKISRKERRFVLKVSGFSDLGSWSKGVTFLNKLSQQQCREVIQEALAGETTFVIQEFKKGKNFQQEYYDFEKSNLAAMNGRVRFTPYFSARNGQMLTAKTTMCANTDFIHAGTDSINSPIQ